MSAPRGLRVSCPHVCVCRGHCVNGAMCSWRVLHVNGAASPWRVLRVNGTMCPWRVQRVNGATSPWRVLRVNGAMCPWRVRVNSDLGLLVPRCHVSWSWQASLGCLQPPSWGCAADVCFPPRFWPCVSSEAIFHLGVILPALGQWLDLVGGMVVGCVHSLGTLRCVPGSACVVVVWG